MRFLLLFNVIAVALTANSLPFIPDVLLEKMSQSVPVSNNSIPCFPPIRVPHPETAEPTIWSVSTPATPVRPASSPHE